MSGLQKFGLFLLLDLCLPFQLLLFCFPSLFLFLLQPFLLFFGHDLGFALLSLELQEAHIR